VSINIIVAIAGICLIGARKMCLPMEKGKRTVDITTE
jgi:hypothetical protein